MGIERGGSLEKGARRLHVILFDLQYTFWLCGKQKYRDVIALWYSNVTNVTNVTNVSGINSYVIFSQLEMFSLSVAPESYCLRHSG